MADQITPDNKRAREKHKISVKNKFVFEHRSGFFILSMWFQELKKEKLKSLASILFAATGFIIGNFVSYLFISNIVNKIAIEIHSETVSIIQQYGFDIISYIVCIILSELVFWRLYAFIFWKQQTNMSNEVYRKCFNAILFEHMDFFNKKKPEELSAAILSFEEAFLTIDKLFRSEFIPIAASFIFVSVVLGPKLPLFTFILIFASILFLLVGMVTSRFITRKSSSISKLETKRIESINEAFKNIETVKAHGTAFDELKKVLFLNKKISLQNSNFYKRYFQRDFSFAFIIVIMSTFLITLISSSHKFFNLDVGTVVLAASYMTVLTQQLWDVTFSLRDFNNAFMQASPIAKILIENERYNRYKYKPPLIIKEGKIELKNLSYCYSNKTNKTREKAIDDISLIIDPKTSVGIVGPNGAGKSTLSKMLMRFVENYKGKILIDDQDISKVKQFSLHSQVGYIKQTNQLFSDTIRNNLIYGNKKLDDEIILKAVKLVGMKDFVEKLPKGLDTQIQVANLSSGQSQSLAIAREILRDTKVLLIDGAFADLDKEHEERIDSFIRRMRNPRTTIMITNNLRLVKNFDTIVIVEKGKIEAIGTHEELLRTSEYYKKEWSN